MTFIFSPEVHDGEVYEMGDGTLCDAYLNQHASN